ncbi:MAG: hypothetical protein IJ072_03345 [Oscillospiraceae bacterium]|nr:hypothetical protein [Oscillospiraceae bacterium]
MFALLLTLVMVCGALPTGVLAASTESAAQSTPAAGTHISAANTVRAVAGCRGGIVRLRL